MSYNGVYIGNRELNREIGSFGPVEIKRSLFMPPRTSTG